MLSYFSLSHYHQLCMESRWSDFITDMYIGLERPILFSHESRTHVNLQTLWCQFGFFRTFLLSFPCLHCRWFFVMEFRAERGQPGPVLFDLPAGPMSDLWILHPLQLLCSSDQGFYLFRHTVVKDTVSKHPLPAPNTHKWCTFLRFLGDVFVYCFNF